MIQFLYQGTHGGGFGGTHGPRARALAAVTPDSRVGDIADTDPKTFPGLDTLAFWGHGDSFKFCNKDVYEFHSLIKDWKSLNSGLETVEIITCNARHALSGDPYANRLKSKLKSGFRSSTRKIKVKALPVTVTGKNNAWSILLAETNFNSWVYITAPGANDSLLMQTQGLLKFHMVNGRSVSYNGDIAQRADELVRTNPQRTWTMNYGYFNTLRATLGEVR